MYFYYMFKWLLTPYPYQVNIKHNFLTSLAIGAFVFLFLLVFEPFGNDIENCNVSNTFAYAGHGTIAAICAALVFTVAPAVFKEYHNEEKWFLWKEIVSTLCLLLLISLGNLIFANEIATDKSIAPYSFERFMISVKYTFTIAIFPVTIFTLVNYNYHLKQNLMRASRYADANRDSELWKINNERVQLNSETVNESVAFELADLLFVSASGNYCEFHLRTDAGYEKQMLRLTLQKAEESLSQYPHVFRTHRAHLVNLHAVSRYDGNAQGIRLYFDDINEVVPVSRRRLSAFDSLMSSVSAGGVTHTSLNQVGNN